MPRLVSDWITEYVDFVKRGSESPIAYHFWSAATVIAATLRRHCWYVRTNDYRIYPNQYTILVGRPGIGKGAAVNPAIDILRKANTANILSDRLTIEFVLEKLAKGFPTQMVSGSGVTFGVDSSCLIFAPELGVFARNSEHSLPDLADLWDCREHPFAYGTRGKGEFIIKSPCPSMLAGSSPKWLVESIPTAAIGGGFTRRVCFVFGNEKSQVIVWPIMNGSNAIRDKLVEDLKHIATHVRGEFTLAPDARQAFEDFYRSAKPDEFDDEATANFISSKWVHAIKLSMALSASREDTRVISKTDFDTAVGEVEKVVTNLKRVFRSVGESDMVSSADKIMRYVEKRGYASRMELQATMWRDVSKFELDVIIQTFIDGGMLVEATSGGKVVYKLANQGVPINP